MIHRLALVAVLAWTTGCIRHITPLAADDVRGHEPAFIAPPPGHPFAAIAMGMESDEVRTVLGHPTSLRRVPTGWTFLPFYLGSGERRTVWRYQDEGRVLFSDHPRTGELEVIRVEYDPGERGV